MITRAMVPVLLCFNVEHDDETPDQQILERIKALIFRNLGDIGEEEDNVTVTPFEDENGTDLDAALYPSDLEWCDTVRHCFPESQPEYTRLPIFSPLNEDYNLCANCRKNQSAHAELNRCPDSVGRTVARH